MRALLRADLGQFDVEPSRLALPCPLGMLLATPVVRRIAVARGVIDRPNEARKVHSEPIAYLGGVAVFLGLLAAGCAL